MYTCGLCKDRNCKKGNFENLPLNCPSNEKDEQEEVKKLFWLKVKDRVLAHNPIAALYLSEGYYESKLIRNLK
ncbi:hypothetical protein CLLI_14850 [Clostridium liquoris]|jgi:hypothetical protein|uniref:Uncharacterized protein n=1 Tax=Clostridium liquoris TaxID=1289519 RepID=A0A2T0B404_9CLOT|nr:hypothetical protein [Clostridium liquoris]PRR78616.1 hypothetical protein CLLI_14850 [Clostridium liquoris]